MQRKHNILRFTLNDFNSKEKSIVLSTNSFFVFRGKPWLMGSSSGQIHGDKEIMSSRQSVGTSDMRIANPNENHKPI
jgi:hypothetical protein